MSDFSLTLVLQIKTSKIINDIAKVQQRSEKITAFGGTFFVLDKFDSILSSVIDSLYIRAICTFNLLIKNGLIRKGGKNEKGMGLMSHFVYAEFGV